MTVENDMETQNPYLLQSLKLTNFLSFGPQFQEVELKPLNLLIGSNGSGKSNLIEAVDLLRSAPKDWLKPIRQGGGVQDWLWNGGDRRSPVAVAVVGATITNPGHSQNLRHQVSFTALNQRFELISESIENDLLRANDEVEGHAYYLFNNGKPSLWTNGHIRLIDAQREQFNSEQSILSQLRDPYQHPEITYLAQVMEKVHIYRDWTFGRNNPARLPQKADLPNDYLAEDASNLGLVLNRFKREPDVKKRLLKALNELYDGIEDYDVSVEGGTVQVFLQEGNTVIPASRLSDGTLRYLCLLAILCHPKPPPLVCIEEPELGLHPDIMPALAELLKEASTRCQLIVTTHSDELVDAMTDQPESVLICERDTHGTSLNRLDADELKPWLEKYRLGDLWTRGEIGGMRW